MNEKWPKKLAKMPIYLIKWQKKAIPGHPGFLENQSGLQFSSTHTCLPWRRVFRLPAWWLTNNPKGILYWALGFLLKEEEREKFPIIIDMKFSSCLRSRLGCFLLFSPNFLYRTFAHMSNSRKNFMAAIKGEITQMIGPCNDWQILLNVLGYSMNRLDMVMNN